MITSAHGAGGRQSQQLVEEHFLPRLGNPVLAELGDSGLVGDLALTTDCYVVTPRSFPGGDIGRLAVCGTVNDLAMAGAEPIALTAGFVLEEGLSFDELDRIVDSMARAAEEAGVHVVAGDTKVVPRHACDGMFITTAGVGRVDPAFRPTAAGARPGDAVIVSGTLGDHGMTVMACRQGLSLRGSLESDVAPLTGLVRSLRAAGVEIHALRDPTRGGAAQSLIEIAEASQVHIVLDESALPVRPAVRSVCELVGIDPLYVANEGKLVGLLPEDQAAEALAILAQDPYGRDTAVIGSVEEGPSGLEIETRIGARRVLRMPHGELLPRIC